MNKDNWISFALSKPELPIYRMLLKSYGYDPDIYRSSRRVHAPPEHYAELADAMSEANAKELVELIYDGDGRKDLLDHCEKMMLKAAYQLQTEEQKSRAREAMDDLGVEADDDITEEEIEDFIRSVRQL